MIAKKYRIDRDLIDYILKKGESFTSKLFIIRYIKNDKGFHRFRTIVSTKIDPKAVKRNKIKRQIYEAVAKPVAKPVAQRSEATTVAQRSGATIPKKATFDIVLIPKKQIKNTKYEEIEKDITKIIQKYGKTE